MTTRRGFFSTLGPALVAASAARVLPVEQAPPIEFTRLYDQEFTYSTAEFAEPYCNPMAKRIANMIDQQTMREYHRQSFDL